VRLSHEEMRGQDFLDDGAHPRQAQMGLTQSTAFALEKAVGDGRQDHVPLPSRQAAPFEVIEPDLVFECDPTPGDSVSDIRDKYNDLKGDHSRIHAGIRHSDKVVLGYRTQAVHLSVVCRLPRFGARRAEPNETKQRSSHRWRQAAMF